MPATPRRARTRLRGTTLLAAPIFVLGVIGATLALATGLWGVWNPDDLGVAFWSVLVISGIVGLGAFVGARGCFVEVAGGTVRDVVGWVTVRRVDQHRIETVRVRAGAWRWFEVQMDDGEQLVLVGAAPAQFPARLMPGSRESDLADLDTLLGEQ